MATQRILNNPVWKIPFAGIRSWKESQKPKAKRIRTMKWITTTTTTTTRIVDEGSFHQWAVQDPINRIKGSIDPARMISIRIAHCCDLFPPVELLLWICNVAAFIAPSLLGSPHPNDPIDPWAFFQGFFMKSSSGIPEESNEESNILKDW